ncbi:MAG: sulfatase-like hydrolase/transferase [bacterium]|nr:sulfatase-like hydrolase/transferase [bacterium]
MACEMGTCFCASPKFRWLVVGLAAGILVAGGHLACRGPESEDAPEPELNLGTAPAELNVILITIDTLRADRLSCYGSTRVVTPHLDALAREGVRFTNAATTVPFTLPAHSSIMTGAYPPRHGVRENVGYFLKEGTPTVAEALRAGGRATAGFVSAFVLDSRWGIARGFDHYFDDFELRDMETPNLSSVQRSGDVTVAAAVRWLDQRPRAPFFLWLHLYDPHDPYTPPEPYKSRYPDHPYDAEVAYTDALVGDFRAALEVRGILDRSLVILTADHGEGLGDHDEYFHGFYVYESTVHVPLIVRLPSPAQAGRVVDRAVSHVDLLPTILEAVRVPIPPGAQGVSLWPLILGREGWPERVVYSESFYPLLHYGWAPLRSVRSGRYKLIDVPRPELYDLDRDRGEEHDLVAGEPRAFRDLMRRLLALREEMERDAPAAAEQPELDEKTVERLRALGYLAGQGGVGVDQEEDRARADPKDKIVLHRMIMGAQSRIGRGEEEAAEELLRQVLARDATILDAHQMLGQLAGRKGRFEEAADHYQRALELDDGHKNSLLGLATAYVELGLADEALLGFRRLLELSPRDTRAVLAMAEIYMERDQLAEAAAVLEQATDTPEAPAMLCNRLGELRVLQERGSEASTLFERAIAGNDELPEPYFNLAVLEEERGEVTQAVAHYEATIERAPRHFRAQFNLGRLYGALGRPDRQQELYEAAIESNPDFVRGYLYLGKLLMDRGGDLARAEELTRQGLAKDPEHETGPLGYFLLADLLNRSGRRAEAQQAVARARAIQEE